MRYKASTLRIIEKLKELYPEGLCSLQYKKDYELLFAVRLSAQCTDARVNLVTPALFARFPTLEAFAEADPKEVGEYIHSCGFYNGKSKDLVACAQQILERFGGRVPDNMEDLTSLPGVGRKTANLMGPRTRSRWSSSCAKRSPRRNLGLSATGWCFLAGMYAPPGPPNVKAAP